MTRRATDYKTIELSEESNKLIKDAIKELKLEM